MLWLNRVTLTLGVALLLSGIVFFFAYNWSQMSKFSKFALIESGIIGAFILSMRQSSSKLTSDMLLLAAAVLTGVVLAVYGQTYQTGADAYTLFLGWGVLISGWIFTARNGPLWVLWLILWNITLVTWYGQVINPDFERSPSVLVISLIVLNSCFILVREFLSKNRMWLKNKAGQLIPQLLVLTCSTFYLLEYILSDSPFSYDSQGFIFPGILFSLGAHIGLFTLYRYIRLRSFPLFLSLAATSIVALGLIGRILSELTDNIGFFFFFTIAVLAVSGSVILYMKSVQNQITENSGGAEHDEIN